MKTKLTIEAVEQETLIVLLERCLATAGKRAAEQIVDLETLRQILASKGLVDETEGEPTAKCTPELKDAIRKFQQLHWEAHPFSCRKGPERCDGIVGSETEVNLLDTTLEESPPIDSLSGMMGSVGMGDPGSDQDMLARVIVLEAGDIGPSTEWIAIANVALNRAQNGPVWDVVANTSWPGGGARGHRFVRRIKGEEPLPNGSYVDEHRRYAEAYELAGMVLSGDVSNPIGDRTHFVHPRGMPKTDQPDGVQVSKTRIAFDGRKMPTWATPISLGGTAQNIKKIGRAVFA